MQFRIRKSKYGIIFSKLPNSNKYKGDYYDYPVVIGPDIKIYKSGKPLDQDTEAFIRFRKKTPGEDNLNGNDWENAFIEGIRTDGDWVVFDQNY